MDIEQSIKKCEISLEQIKQYDPDPFYVKHFLKQYITSINSIISGIFEEADRDFGLFVTRQISEKTFYKKAKDKNDINAIKFSEWFSEKYKQSHKNPYPGFMSEMCVFENLPKIKIMIRVKNRYKDDINHQIIVRQRQEKLQSKDELKIEIRRQLPVFLQVINHKRDMKNEPGVKHDDVVASAFASTQSHSDIEIVHAAEIYIPVVKRLINESRKRVKELTSQKQSSHQSQRSDVQT